jgi:hypothetical protein
MRIEYIGLLCLLSFWLGVWLRHIGGKLNG